MIVVLSTVIAELASYVYSISSSRCCITQGYRVLTHLIQAGITVEEQNDSMFGYFIVPYVLNSLLGSLAVGALCIISYPWKSYRYITYKFLFPITTSLLLDVECVFFQDVLAWEAE